MKKQIQTPGGFGFRLNNNNKEVDKFIKGNIGENHWIFILPYLNTQRPG